MSETQKRAFYGEDGRAPLCAVMANLVSLTGSEVCARELIEAADYVEIICGPEAALTQMPWWVN